MKRWKFWLGLLAVLCGTFAVAWVLQHEKTLITHPKGIMAQSELELIITNFILMALVVVPTFVGLFIVVARHRMGDTSKEYDPEHSPGKLGLALMWGIPSVIVVAMSVVTWIETHRLDPFVPIDTHKEPLVIQVIAIDWKWLFIYPKEDIATINYIEIPEQTPIRFELIADASPMNSFWIPQLSGQMYSMTGMINILHMSSHGPGEYIGRAAEINGSGYAGMTFVVKAKAEEEFTKWVETVKKSPLQLSKPVYNALLAPTENHPQTFYSTVEKGLFDHSVMKFMPEHEHHNHPE